LKKLQIQEIRVAAIETLKETITMHDLVRKFVLDQEDEKVLVWLLANRLQNNHNNARKKHQAGTGEWFIQSDGFTRFTQPSKTSLWVHGKAGFGKTILCSTVIQHIVETNRSSPDFQAAWFYFDFELKWNVDDMLRSVIAQLCRSMGKLPVQLHQLYRECQRGQTPLTSSLIEILVLLADSCSKTYLVLDALDECEPGSGTVDLLQALKGLVEDSKVLSLLVTSRKEERIEEVLKPVFGETFNLEENVVKSDIGLYVRSMLKNDATLKTWDEDTKLEIEQTLVARADGMYLPDPEFPFSDDF
jgi:hypothetical protein